MRLRFVVLAACLLVAPPVLGRELSKASDKALYCGYVYLEAARLSSSEGEQAAARVIRAYGKEWLSYAYGLSDGMTRREVNAFKPQYQAEAKADVAARHYRHDCSKR